MGRVLGKIENDSIGTRYFVHCSTSGYSLRPLFRTSKEVWDNYAEMDSKTMEQAVPALSKTISVASVSISYSKQINSAEDIMQGPFFGLVTEDSLLFPTSEENHNISFILFNGILHIGRKIDDGFLGSYEEPVCQIISYDFEGAKVYDIGDYLNKPLTLCEHCVAVATKEKS